MKPSLLTLGLATSLVCAPALLCAPARLCAQTKSAPPELLATAPGWTADNPLWGTVPPPKPLPYGYVWNEYRGAEIEHPLYAPRHHGHVHRAPHASCLVSQFSCWFDKLFCRKCASPTPAAHGGHVATELPPLPTLAPFPPAAVPQNDNIPAELAPLPVPAAPQVALPAPPQGREPAPPVDSSDSAPIMPPVELIPTRPLVTNDPPQEPAPGSVATEPVPILPVPVEPPPSPPSPAAVSDPKPIASERTPVIELAPDFVVPGGPTPVVPQQVVPPDVLVPRNVIPQRAVPSNTIPGRRP